MTELQAARAGSALGVPRIETISRRTLYLDILIALAAFIVLAILPMVARRSDSSSSRSEIGSRFGLGIWMPTVDLPGMRSISTDSASIARHKSSARPVTRAYLTPASGLNSNVVTTGPG